MLGLVAQIFVLEVFTKSRYGFIFVVKQFPGQNLVIIAITSYRFVPEGIIVWATECTVEMGLSVARVGGLREHTVASGIGGEPTISFTQA